jgi:hypothetical protein
MTNQQHPITPPPELVTNWILESDIPGEDMCEGIATRAAHAVLDAYTDAPISGRVALAAALRAAADQVVPETHAGFARHSIRLCLLAIAAELEGADA